MNAHTNSFGDFQTSLRINGRCYLGVGHTPAESRRNAFDAIADRNPDLAGFCAVMRTSNVNAERVSATRILA